MLRCVMAAAGAGLVAGGVLGVGRPLSLALTKGSVCDLTGWPYAIIVYGLVGLIAGFGTGIVLALSGRLRHMEVDVAHYRAAAGFVVLFALGFVVALFHVHLERRILIMVTVAILGGCLLFALVLGRVTGSDSAIRCLQTRRRVA